MRENLSPGWHGNLNLAFDYRHNATVLANSQAQAPLKIQRPFYPEGPEVCHSVVLHTAGGVVGGDRLSLNFHIKNNAQALITTPAASKIYRSNGLQAKQTIQIQIDADACLEWLPQETIVFNGAIYRQDLRVELAPGARWIGWEITRFGRSAKGEKFCLGEWQAKTEIWQQQLPLWIDRQWLSGEEMLNSPHGLAGQPVVGSLVWIGQEVSPELVEEARNLWKKTDTYSPQPHTQPRSLVGVTRLQSGLLCRYCGSSTTEVKNWFTHVWQILRKSFLGRTSCTPRVWPL